MNDADLWFAVAAIVFFIVIVFWKTRTKPAPQSESEVSESPLRSRTAFPETQSLTRRSSRARRTVPPDSPSEVRPRRSTSDYVSEEPFSAFASFPSPTAEDRSIDPSVHFHGFDGGQSGGAGGGGSWDDSSSGDSFSDSGSDGGGDGGGSD